MSYDDLHNVFLHCVVTPVSFLQGSFLNLASLAYSKIIVKELKVSQGLGLSYARSLVEAGSDCLVLTSRTAAMTKGDLVELARKGTAVFVLQADAAARLSSRLA